MTYEEKKSLYESIMKDVAKSVKRQINEAEDSLDDEFSPIKHRFDNLPNLLRKAKKDFRQAIPVLLNVIDRFEEIIDKKDERWLREFQKAVNPDWL